MKRTVGIIGCGVMGGAMARAMIERGGWTLVVFDRNADARKKAATFGAIIAQDVKELCAKCATLILAVKPQQASELFARLRPLVTQEHLIVSVMAGISSARIASALGTKRVVRAMPNTPAIIREGMTLWWPTSDVGQEAVKWAKTLFGTLGTELEVDSEDIIDRGTAVSGSGPAYVFLLAEALEESAIALGFSPEHARMLVAQTLFGSSVIYKEKGQSPEELRRAVTSPGGTTQSAMEVIDPKKFVQLWKQATRAAYERAKELSVKE